MGGPVAYIDGLVLQVTQNIATIEVAHLPRAEGTSNYTIRKLIHLWLNMFVNFSIMPLHISTILGGVLSAVGILGAVEVTIEYLIWDAPQGYGTIILRHFNFLRCSIIYSWSYWRVHWKASSHKQQEATIYYPEYYKEKVIAWCHLVHFSWMGYKTGCNK